MSDANGLLVAGRVGITHVEGKFAGVALLLNHSEQVGQGLERVVPIALHVEDRGATRLGHCPDVIVADSPVDVADGDAVVIATQDLADLLPRVAVADLGAGAIEEHGVAAELGHAGLKTCPGPSAGEEEEHGQYLVPQQGMGLAERPPALEIEGHVNDRVEFVLGPLLGGDHVPSVQVGLHVCSLVRLRLSAG